MTLCVECTCTDDAACFGGCHWVLKRADGIVGLCSRCMPSFIGFSEADVIELLDDYEDELLANRISDEADREYAGELLLPGSPEFETTLRHHIHR